MTGSIKKLVGTWRITDMEQWDLDYIDLVEPGRFSFRKGGSGNFNFGTCFAELYCDWEPELERFVFTFDGDSEGDPESGCGWFTVTDDEITGVLQFHRGDKSGFTAKREAEGS